MPLSEADSRTVLPHLEVIRNIIRGMAPGRDDIRDVAAGFEPPTPAAGSALAQKMSELCGPKAYQRNNSGSEPARNGLADPAFQAEFCKNVAGHYLAQPDPAPASAPRVFRADGSVETFVEPDLDGGCAAEATATASRGTKWVV